MQVPPELNYNQLQTKAFFSVYKSCPILPISSGGQFWPGEVIKINLTGFADGVMDPYRSHLQFTVTCDSTTLPVGLLQIDNSAQSLIQTLIISSKTIDVERIVQYSVLAAYLTDIGISEIYTQGREVQGLGYNNIDNYSSIYNSTLSAGRSGSFQDRANFVGCTSTGGVFPTIPTKSNLCSAWNTDVEPAGLVTNTYRGHISWANPCWIAEQPEVWWWYIYTQSDNNAKTCNDTTRFTLVNQFGYQNNLRAEYLSHHLSNQYIDTTSSLSKLEIRLNANVQNNTFPAKFIDNVAYNTYVPATIPYMFGDPSTDTLTTAAIPNISPLLGFSSLFSPNFAKGVRQPFISPTVPQCQMQNGLILDQKIPIATRVFKIPLISAVLGLLIPESQFVLIPLRALNEMSLQFLIDEHAMFTSGYNDVSQYDNVGMGLMQKRAFKVTKIVYNLHTYQFFNAQMDEYLRVNLTTGIAINTKFWQLANQYQVENSQSLSNAWPVSCSQQALNEVLVLFYPLDYQNFSFCRKHFRLSNNLRGLQLKINMEYFPSQALSGNGGNPIAIDNTGDNGIFLEQMNMANGFAFCKTVPMPKINAYNFAINDRCYNILNTHTLYDPSMIDDPKYVWTSSSINYDTAMGMANIHQNRYVGKAAYVYSFQPYSHSKNFLTGLDCRAVKQFDILFTSNPDSWFPRAQTMYIFTCSSVIMEYGRDGVMNITKRKQ